MILLILDIIILCYIGLGFGFWIVPCECNGYYACGFENYNFLFIFFWLPAMFNEKILKVISK